MSPFRDPAPIPKPRSFEELSDETLCDLFIRNRKFYLAVKDAFAFEDAQRDAERLIRSVDPEAIIILTVTPSDAVKQQLDWLSRLRGELGNRVDSEFGLAEKIQSEWKIFRESLSQEGGAKFDAMSESEQVRALIKARRRAKPTYLRWLTTF